ncbi:MAG: chromosome segregation ATPase [Bermanella sp.]|jgi:chromosome segregation ATPase
MADERLIDRDPDAEDDGLDSDVAFYKSPLFILVLKISATLGVISSLLTGLIITNNRLSNLEVQISVFSEQVTTFQGQHETVIQNVKLLTKSNTQLVEDVGTLDLGAAKGELSEALTILNTQSDAINKQLAVTRNGLISLSRMIKGSRVWQDDYKGKYQSLFDDNKTIIDSIKKLRGIQEKPEEPDPAFLEMDF